MGSEAYGMLHGIKLFYNQERFVAPFQVRRYTRANADLSTIYRPKLFTNNEYENELKFDEYAESYYKSRSTSHLDILPSTDKFGDRNLKLFRNKYLHSEHLASRHASHQHISSKEDLQNHGQVLKIIQIWLCVCFKFAHLSKNFSSLKHT